MLFGIVRPHHRTFPARTEADEPDIVVEVVGDEPGVLSCIFRPDVEQFQLQGIRGEFRRFTSAEVGGVIRMFRQLQGLKRAVLAADANVSEKTIERAEAGEGISEVSCRRIARALGMKENAFTDALYIPTLEEVERIQKQNEEKIRQTHL